MEIGVVIIAICVIVIAGLFTYLVHNEKINNMTDKEKLIKIKKLADAMYYAAQYLTTDASKLHKAMDEYHQFVIQEYYKEEPVSEDLEEAAHEYADLRGANYETAFYAFMTGAKWQKQQDQETIELAEDHAMLAGMEKMKEQMMKDAVEGKVLSCEGLSFPVSNEIHRLGLAEGDKVKVIIIKNE